MLLHVVTIMTKTVRVSDEAFRFLRDQAMALGTSLADLLDSILEEFFEDFEEEEEPEEEAEEEDLEEEE